MKNESVWIVTYLDFGSEPVVTAFNDEEAANKCYKYFKKCHELCFLDKCPIYSHFLESEGQGMNENQRDVLDKIRDEIERLHYHPKLDFIKNDEVVEMALDVIDKYKAESEE